MQIDAYFDPICPWCYIGKRRLAHALSLRPHIQAQIDWHPFLLNPDMPTNGMDRSAYLLGKFGTESRVRRLLGALEEFGQSESIAFQFEDISQTPSTIDAHRLVRFARDFNKDGDVVEGLFHAYFNEGRDIGDFDVLAQIADSAGLEPTATQEALDGAITSQSVMEENAKAHRLGINGVPCYVIDGRFAVQGAQMANVLTRILDAASVSAA